MVLGLRSKIRKGPTVHVDYLVYVQEIKPWPPSQSLKSLRSVVLQWENGEKNSGSTSSVVPSLGSGVGDGRIEFGESFRLPVTLSREFSLRSGDGESFQKNYLEFNLYEPRRDKAVRGQHLGNAVVDLAEYGVLKETMIISAQMSCKRNFRNTTPPVLVIKIQPFDKHSSSSIAKAPQSIELSSGKDSKDSVSALMNEEYDEESEIASFTDDDVSSHSSVATSSAFETSVVSSTKDEEWLDNPSSLQLQNAIEQVKDSTEKGDDQSDLPLEPTALKLEVNQRSKTEKYLNRGSSSPAAELSCGGENPENKQASLHGITQTNVMAQSGIIDADYGLSNCPSMTHEFAGKEIKHNKSINSPNLEDLRQEELSEEGSCGNRINVLNVQDSEHELKINRNSVEAKVEYSDDPGLNDEDSQLESEDHRKIPGQTNNNSEVFGVIDGAFVHNKEKKYGDSHREDEFNGKLEAKNCHSTEHEYLNEPSPKSIENMAACVGERTGTWNGVLLKTNSLSSDRQMHVRSVRSSSDSLKVNGSASSNQIMGERRDIHTLDSPQSQRKGLMTHSRETRTSLSDGKLQQLENRLEKLEDELREAAALELALYSVVAEHGSSVNKVHAPARRLSRLYIHAWKQSSEARRASAAKSAISGLVLVAKACGNDVPRLTFWLSNSVVLRAIISSVLVDSKSSVLAGCNVETNGNRKDNGIKSILNWRESSPSKIDNKFGNWEDPNTFTTALEKIEAWIFSRIIESVWWQTFTPHMQPASRKANEQKIRSSLRNSFGKKPILSDQEQAHFSAELWKKAFKDACEKLCPVRAAGHECGCLPVLARLVMEQCVDRLDVAMFNAVLRESDDEIPTDPVSDPISDSKVLPIPAGKSSFGAGAQLKNTIGNWSRWLTDLFGIDDGECHEEEYELDDNGRQDSRISSKSFLLLNALSDLMMLPKDMLLNRSIRKEVCPKIGSPLIKRILSNFTPDEFCLDPIPDDVFEALDAEDLVEADEELSIRNFPCDAAPAVYSPPSIASLESIVGEVGESSLTRSSSSLLRKSYTSDDELEELDSPCGSIFDSNTAATPKWRTKDNNQHVVRYRLLQAVWRD
ncbi:hypothetical protein Sjap_016457 [Stephania japonica]|uniref:C2 NT-type domain-containing protein n=1 Tax=Stephania japonica TaxID=461633 RepID=A0AAP0ILZ1_9MAGN